MWSIVPVKERHGESRFAGEFIRRAGVAFNLQGMTRMALSVCFSHINLYSGSELLIDLQIKQSIPPRPTKAYQAHRIVNSLGKSSYLNSNLTTLSSINVRKSGSARFAVILARRSDR